MTSVIVSVIVAAIHLWEAMMNGREWAMVAAAVLFWFLCWPNGPLLMLGMLGISLLIWGYHNLRFVETQRDPLRTPMSLSLMAVGGGILGGVAFLLGLVSADVIACVLVACGGLLALVLLIVVLRPLLHWVAYVR